VKLERPQGGKSYDTKENSRGNYELPFVSARRMLPCFPMLNGSSVSGDETNNIDLPVNGIISQSARCGCAACLLRGASALARRRNKCLHRNGKPLYPETSPFTPVLHFRHFLTHLHFRMCLLPLAKCTRNEPRREGGQCFSARKSLSEGNYS